MTATQVMTPRTEDVQPYQRTGRMLPTAVAVAGLWLAMALSSLFAPDLISSSQDHVPIVAITIWIWGAVATGFVLFGAAFPARDRVARWGLPVAVLGIWGAVALVSVFAPTIVAGSDGTIGPVRFWSVAGPNGPTLDALGERRLGDLHRLIPTAAEEAEQLQEELAASLGHLQRVDAAYWEREWRRDHKGLGIYPEDHLWRATHGYLDLLAATRTAGSS